VTIVKRDWFTAGRACTKEALPENVGRKELKKPQEHLNPIFRRFLLLSQERKFRCVFAPTA
jgi:hypothetical protein